MSFSAKLIFSFPPHLPPTISFGMGSCDFLSKRLLYMPQVIEQSLLLFPTSPTKRGNTHVFDATAADSFPFSGGKEETQGHTGKKPCIFPHFSPLKIACGVISEKKPPPFLVLCFPLSSLSLMHDERCIHFFIFFCVSRKCGKMHAVRSFYFNAQRYTAEERRDFLPSVLISTTDYPPCLTYCWQTHPKIKGTATKRRG